MKKFKNIRVKNNLSQMVIIFLIVMAFILGYMIVKDNPNYNVNKLKTNNTKANASSSSKQSSATLSAQQRSLPSNLTADEMLLLNPPAPDASKDDKDKHFAIVNKLAKDSDTLNLNKCSKPEPLDMRIKLGSEIKIKNDDTVDHTIVFDPTHTYTIPAGKTQAVTIAFPYGQGAYGYLCDHLAGVVGFFLVAPQ